MTYKRIEAERVDNDADKGTDIMIRYSLPSTSSIVFFWHIPPPPPPLLLGLVF